MEKPVSPPGANERLIAGQPGMGADACQALPLRAGDACPVCGAARLDYNGLLELACPICGYSQCGSFT